MKKESGMGLLAIIFIIVLIIVLVVLGYYTIKKITKDKKLEDIKANMLLIQGKCKILEENTKVNKNEDNILGKKVSDMKEDQIVAQFLEKNIIPEDKLDKYYVLSNEDLNNMEIDVQNEENSYYIVNYEEDSVYITKGYMNEETNEIVYKLEE